MTENDKGFICGFCVCAAFISRDHGEPGMAMDAFNSSGIKLKDCLMAEVDEYDLKEIKKMCKSEK